MPKSAMMWVYLGLKTGGADTGLGVGRAKGVNLSLSAIPPAPRSVCEAPPVFKNRRRAALPCADRVAYDRCVIQLVHSSMYHEFILDLKAMRKKSGLSQEDCAHLIGTTTNVFGRIERGERQPTVEEICALQLLFGRTFESFYATCIADARRRLKDNLTSLPILPDSDSDTLARDLFLQSLSKRLKVNQERHDG